MGYFAIKAQVDGNGETPAAPTQEMVIYMIYKKYKPEDKFYTSAVYGRTYELIDY